MFASVRPTLVVSLQVEEATVVVEDDSPAEPASTPGTLRNLSAWSVTIPDVKFCDDEAKIPVFCIHVERNDRKEGESCVPPAQPAGCRRRRVSPAGGAHFITVNDDVNRLAWLSVMSSRQPL